jgi:hypothetical protein
MTFSVIGGGSGAAASGIIRLMSKQCCECGTVATDEEGYCNACGGRSWQGVRDQETELILLNWFSVVFMLGLIAASYWLLVWRVPVK